MSFSIQQALENNKVRLTPLKADDFNDLYDVASDKEVWAQHPNKDRWKKEVFQQFFEGAIQSGGAFKILDLATGSIAGCTRFYDYNAEEKRIMIGYTFYATRHWGTGLNPSVKRLMMDYIFQYVDKVLFHVGAVNIRSQIAIIRLGAKKVAEQDVAYYGEASKLNFVYEINKQDYLTVS